MLCPNCGATVTQGQRFCDNCGMRLGADATLSEGQPLNAPIGQPPIPPSVPVQPGAYQTQPDTYVPQVVPNSNMAIISLVAGVLSWVMLPLIGAVVAVVCGHLARKEIRESGGRLAGQGMATAGLVLGYIQIALAVLGLCIGMVFFFALLGAL